MPNFTKGYIWLKDKTRCSITWNRGDIDWLFNFDHYERKPIRNMFQEFRRHLADESSTLPTRLDQILADLNIPLFEEDGPEINKDDAQWLYDNLQRYGLNFFHVE